ncbi:DNA primase [Pseudomonas sp. LS-2]|nr:DNA primase [Pseudomonas sp. LS-2]
MRNLKADVVRKAALLNGWDQVLRNLCPEISTKAFDKPGKHVACPVHGKSTRSGDGFRFLNKKVPFRDSGGAVCNTCGIFADGFALLMWLKGINFADAVAMVGAECNIRTTDDENAQERINKESQAKLAERKRAFEEKERAENVYLRGRLNQIWSETFALTHPIAEPGRLYLASRKILCWDKQGAERAVRFHPSLASYNEDGQFEGDYPAIVAKVSKQGRPITLHRYFLTEKGMKAPVESCKKMCAYPSDVVVTGGGIFVQQPVGWVEDVCEGLETAWAIETGMDLVITVVPTVNATLLESFEPGPQTKLVRIWADKDKSGRGEQAALELKKRLWEKGIQAQILLPPLPIAEGEKSVDWNDVLIQLGRMGFPKGKRAVA